MDVCCFGSELGYLAPVARKLDAEILFCPKSSNLSSFSKRFSDIIAKLEYDIVHCHSETWSGPILRGAKNSGVPVRIGHIRSVLPQGFSIVNPILKVGKTVIVRWGHFWLLRYAAHILGVSNAALDERLPQWRKKKDCYIWTLGVDTEDYGRSIPRRELVKEERTIINVGSFIPQRGQDLLLRAYSHVPHIPERFLRKPHFWRVSVNFDKCVVAEQKRLEK